MKKQQRGLFDESHRYERLSKLQDPLEQIKAQIDWEAFRTVIEGAYPVVDYKKGGRPPFDKLMLFKIIVLEQYYGLSDHAAEFQITDRLSFMRFLDLTLADRVPDSNTIWNFREVMTKTGTLDKLFLLFEAHLRSLGLIVQKGTIIDATIVKAPVQRNTREENKEIKEGKVPKKWSKKKRSHKDVDANWTAKHGKQYYGYKNHVKVDADSKLITNYMITPASTHDSQMMEDLIDPADSGQTMYADSAYSGTENRKAIRKNKQRVRVHFKASRNKPLTEYKKKMNTEFSKVRCRVEHVFGHMRKVAGGYNIRCVGLDRAAGCIALMNLAYNFWRTSFLLTSQG